MSEMSQQGSSIAALINTDRFPLHAPDTEEYRKVIGGVQQQLAAEGSAVLTGFIAESALRRLAQEVKVLDPLAYRAVETVNAYNIDVESDLPADHPGRIQFERGNAFVARDLIPETNGIQQIYTSDAFQRFIADCFNMPALYTMADPLAGLVVNVLDPGCQHPWHFDTNSFTVSLLTQAPDVGGEFEYVPDARAPGAENFAEIYGIISGTNDEKVRRLDLLPGDLQLFQGRFALHRVAPVAGQRGRHSVIFAYCDRPGVLSKPERSRQLFGRILPVHHDPSLIDAGADALLD